MAAWVREKEKTPETGKKKKREGGEVDNVEVTPEMTLGSLRCSRATLIRPTQGLPERCQPRRWEGLRTLRVLCCRFMSLGANTK